MLERKPEFQLMDMGVGDVRDRLSSRLRWLLCLIYTGLITVLSLIPSVSFDDIPMFMKHEDKVAHFIAYAVLVAVFWWSMRLHGTGAVKKLFLTAVLCALYGLFLEFMQEMVQPGDRLMSFWDALSNLSGALAAAFVLRKWTLKSTSRIYLR